MRLFILFLLAIHVGGCGVFQQVRDGVADAEYKPYHETACGPEALSDLFARFGVDEAPEAISRDILRHQTKSHASIRRNLGVFDHRAYEITFPSEIIRACRRRGFDAFAYICTDDGGRSLIKNAADWNSQGIALSVNTVSGMMHYEAFPPVENVGKLFRENNRIVMVFLVAIPPNDQ